METERWYLWENGPEPQGGGEVEPFAGTVL